MKLGGYSGKILRIDLSTGRATTEEQDPRILYNFIGARGLAEWFYYNEVDPKIEPFSPENKLVIMTGALTGTQVPGTGRMAFVSKSPLTGTLFESSLGGMFGAVLKWAGLDGIILEGRAEKPSYILIHNDEVKVMDAGDLWGKLTGETEAELKKRHMGGQVISIGPAGENLAYLASVMHATRTAGRGGMGAILGSKKVKAIVVIGNSQPSYADRVAYERGLKRIQGIIMGDPVTGVLGSLATFGTNAIIHRVNDASTLPVNDFSERKMEFETVDLFSGETVRENYFHSKSGCYRCPTVCGRVVKIGGKTTKGPEYETIAMIGANGGFHDFAQEIVPLSNLCDELGLDTISIGSILGFARTAGLLSGSTGRKEVFEAASKLVEEIAYGRSPFSQGVLRAAQTMKREEMAMHVKGLEVPAYDPRGAMGMALNYATCNKGADHTSGYTVAPELFGHPAKVDPQARKGKAHLVIRMQDSYTIYDSADTCIYHSIADFDDLEFQLDIIAGLLTAVTGLRFTSEGLHNAARRVCQMERVFNQKAGLSPKDDRLPDRFHLNIDEMLEEYYLERGWPGGYAGELPELDEPVFEEKYDLFMPALRRVQLPQIQVALDVPRSSIEHIARIAREAYRGGARIIEAGTPAVKMHNLKDLISAIRKEAPDALIMADLKTYDMGKLEAEIAIEAGADIVSVLGKSGRAVVGEALSEAKRRDKAVFVDLMGCTAEEVDALVKEFGRDSDHIIFSLHLGVTQQMKERGIYSQKALLQDFVRKAGKAPKAVAGGLKEGTLKDPVALGIDILVIGSAIYNASDPRAATERMMKEVYEGLKMRRSVPEEGVRAVVGN